MAETPESRELKEQNRLLKQQLGEQAARLEMLLQLVAAKSEPERIQMLEKQALKAKRDTVRKEAIAVAMLQLGKGAKKEQVTHVRYVTGGWYQRKGVNYKPGSVLKIPVTEEPAQDWRPWKPPRISQPVAIDPDAAGTPYGEVRQNTSMMQTLKRDEASAMKAAVDAGDVVISTTTPDQGEQPPPTTVEELQQLEQQPATEPGPESALTPRASDTNVG